MLYAVKRFFSSTKILLCITLITSFALLTAIAFHLQLEILRGVFLAGILELLLMLVLPVQFFVNVLWSFVLFCWFVFKRRKISVMVLLPLVINIMTILLPGVVPLSTVGMKCNWLSHYHARMKVVEMIQNNECSPEMLKTGQLPEEYKNVAEGGRVIISRHGANLSVFFFVTTGLLNSDYCGFAYVSDRNAAEAGLGGPHLSTKRIEDCWFWCESTE